MGAKYVLVFVCSLLQIFLTKYDISVVPKDHSESYRSPYVVQDAAEMGIELVPNRNEFMSYSITIWPMKFGYKTLWKKTC